MELTEEYPIDKWSLAPVQLTPAECTELLEILAKEADRLAVNAIWESDEAVDRTIVPDKVTGRIEVPNFKRHENLTSVVCTAHYVDGGLTLRHGVSGSSLQSSGQVGRERAKRLVAYKWRSLARRAVVPHRMVWQLQGAALSAVALALAMLTVDIVGRVSSSGSHLADWILPSAALLVAGGAFISSTVGHRSAFVSVRSAKRPFVAQKGKGLLRDRGFIELVIEFVAAVTAVIALLR
jgi:hypothetical protein